MSSQERAIWSGLSTAVTKMMTAHIEYVKYLPEWHSLSVAMIAESKSGQKKVSKDLLPRLRTAANRMIVLSSMAAEASVNSTQLSSQLVQFSTNREEIQTSLSRAVCVFEKSTHVLSALGEIS